MRLKMYRDPEVLYSSNNEHYRQLHKAIVESFNGKGTNVGIANISEGKYFDSLIFNLRYVTKLYSHCHG